jgi:hypothetical protein
MKTRVDSVPVYESSSGFVDASHYNRVHLALNRLGAPLRVALPQLRGMEMLFDPDLWVVVDTGNNDLPIIAWSEFALREHTILDAPVHCLIRAYHVHASLIATTALDQAVSQLDERLASKRAANSRGIRSIDEKR